MAVKVHYTFDKEAKVNYLARHPHTLQVQTIPIDEATAIGVVDLRACLHAVTDCSPELAGQECDYTIYAVDYSEPDTPLVGQGLLSWTLGSMRGGGGNQQPKMVTGRVTKNMLAVFGGGNRETLEVKLKLSETAKIQRPVDHGGFEVQQARPMETVLTPTGTSEWNSFIQSNPHIGQPTTHGSRVASPALSQGPPAPVSRRGSFGPAFSQAVTSGDIQRIAPVPVDPRPGGDVSAASSRPSSRASNRPPRKRQPTGRPRGRPRKKPLEGNTSGYEDGTEGEDGPAKKRAKTTKADKSNVNPFSAEPESLRVTASTSGSLRNFRPIAANIEGVPGSHLQEIPRAPTPVPNIGPAGRGGKALAMRRESTLSQPPASSFSLSTGESRQPLSPGLEDGRSPESLAPTPNYSEPSPPDIGSSPPVRRITPFIRSSPPPSSPVLPPMPPAEIRRDASFATNEIDDLFGEEPLPPPEEELPPLPPLPIPRKVAQAKNVAIVPFQVFQIKGPSGQDLVHVCSYNTPHPSSTAPAPADAPSFAPVRQANKRPRPAQPTKKKAQRPSPPPLAPTPPPTTDAIEKALSPIIAPVLAPAPPSAPPLSPPPATAAVVATPAAAVATPAVATPAAAVAATPPAAAAIPVAAAAGTAPPSFRAIAPAPIPRPRPSPPPLDPVPSEVVAASIAISVPEPTDSATKIADSSTKPVLQNAPVVVDSAIEELHTTKTNPPPPAPKPQPAKPKNSRSLNRSQSAGPLALPSVPASEPIGPSSLSQHVASAPECSIAVEAPAALRRAASTGPSTGPLALPMPDGVPAEVVVPEDSCSPFENMQNPPSPHATKSNKNIVKKYAIKQRLEEAINNGQPPPYCANCGAIETPTWRKIWTQDRDTKPEDVAEYSEKPGKVTAIESMDLDASQSKIYRIIKKSLGPYDERGAWQERLLCNPCGIWLTKCKFHRPQDRWDKDASRKGQERRRRGTGRNNSRAKKSQSRGDSQVNLTSELYLPTDAIGPVEPSSPKPDAIAPTQMDLTECQEQEDDLLEDAPTVATNMDANNKDARSIPGSTHSRGSGTAKSPIDVEFDEGVGSTRRLLFPSPRKDGVPKALCELNVNIVKTFSNYQQVKGEVSEKENVDILQLDLAMEEHDDIEALFRSPAKERPSTPPPNPRSATDELFKTPTHPTPSHRPVTRSVSRSLRSIRSFMSPSQQSLERTPTRTPRTVLAIPGSGSVRRSPRNHQVNFDIFDTPISRTISRMLSEPNGFGNLGDGELDMGLLPTLGAHQGGLIDFGNLLSTDDVMPSSPPKDGSLSFDYSVSTTDWPHWGVDHDMDAEE